MTPTEIMFIVIAAFGVIGLLLVLIFDRKTDKKKHTSESK